MWHCWKQCGLSLNFRGKNWLFSSKCTVFIIWLSWDFEARYKLSKWWIFGYKKVSLPSKILTYLTKILILNIQTILFEINLRKEKWLFVSIYKSQSQSNQYVLDMYFDSQENKFILRDFNLEPSNSSIASFMNNQN